MEREKMEEWESGKREWNSEKVIRENLGWDRKLAREMKKIDIKLMRENRTVRNLDERENWIRDNRKWKKVDETEQKSEKMERESWWEKKLTIENGRERNYEESQS